MYNAFAEVYDELMTDVNYKAWADYVFRNFLNTPKEVKSVLEFGCGTGNITIPLAERGYEITAVDISEEMLTQADEKIREKGLRAQFYLGDMASFKIEKSFDAVIACCDIVNYLDSLDKIGSFLDCSYDALKPRGTLLFDMNTVEKFKSIAEKKTIIYDTDNVYCVWENEAEKNTNRIDYQLTIFKKIDNDLYERSDECQSQFIYQVEDVFHLLKKCGYRNTKVYTFGSFLAGGNESERVQFIAEKE